MHAVITLTEASVLFACVETELSVHHPCCWNAASGAAEDACCDGHSYFTAGSISCGGVPGIDGIALARDATISSRAMGSNGSVFTGSCRAGPAAGRLNHITGLNQYPLQTRLQELQCRTEVPQTVRAPVIKVGHPLGLVRCSPGDIRSVSTVRLVGR